MSVEGIAVLLLAAGRSRRFGGEKLSAELGGLPLCHHAARMLRELPFARHIAVVEQASLGLDELGFEIVCTGTGTGAAAMSRSIATGVGVIAALAPDGLLLALADMPFVPAAHIARMAALFDGNLLASSAGGSPQPPAIFGPSHFDSLLRLEGDKGARDLLGSARLVEAQPEWLQDIDTRTDLERARVRLSAQ